MSTIRVDRARLPRVQRTDEGYLRGEAIVTRIGVFSYQNADGTIRKELRHPDDVLAAASLDSLKMIPVTVDHPGELVSAENARTLAVGQTGENVRVDGRHIVAPVNITHKEGIDAINQGKQELSLGYKLDLVQEDGVYEGEAYTHRQTNIVYNHLAIVDAARAGRAARLNLDGASVQIIETDPVQEKNMNKINIDGLQYDAAPEVDRHVQKLTARVDQLEAEKTAANSRADKAEANRDEAKERADKAEQALAEASNADAIGKQVKARIELLAKAQQVPGVNADELLKLDSDRAIQAAALKVGRPSIALDGKSDDYVAARFDAMLDDLGSRSSAAALAPARGDSLDATPQSIRNDEQRAEEAWQKSLVDMNAWRNKA